MPHVSRSSSPRGAKDGDVTVIVDAFRRILRELRRAARKTELATGMSSAQTFVLSAIDASPGCSLNDVAAATMTDRTSVAAIVEKLLDERYITRAQDDADRRRVALSITPRGKLAIRKAAPPPTKLLVDALCALPADVRSGLAAALTDVSQHMGVADEPAGMLFEDGRGSQKKG